MSNLSILIIDNNRSRSQSLKMLLEFMDFTTTLITHLSENKLSQEKYDLLIYGDKSAIDILSALRQLTISLPQTPFVLLENDQPLPLDVLKQQFPLCLGVFNEPFKQDGFLSLIAGLFPSPSSKPRTGHDGSDKSSGNYKQAEKIKTDTPQIDIAVNLVSQVSVHPYLEENLIGQSEGIKKVRKLIQQVANSNANVLILGDSGTGKEVVARCVHHLSKRQTQAYVPVNCGAIPADLLESELFGHEKGAFTGAINARQGRFELAQEGTLFLDEIGDMPLAMQVKILRILQEKMFERVGGNKSIIADVRILAATHRNLEERVADGSFREDLFYRLNVFPIEIPPLRDRVSDIPLLIQFLNQAIEQERDESVKFSEQALASIFLHSWPGNIRELANLVERLAIIFGSDLIQYDDLPEKYQYSIEGFDYSKLTEYENIETEATIAPKFELKKDELNNNIKVEIAENRDLSATNVNLKSNVETQLNNKEKTVFDLADDGTFDLKLHLGNLEQRLIEDALEKSNNVVAHAAKRLNIRRTTLVEKMRKYAVSGK
ncbi:MAG: sigma-54 dependent transcriptional regulator [Pseudomonadota bacterium]